MLSTVDFIVLLAYMAAMVAIGAWLGRGQRTGEDYMLGGRNLPWWALLGSIVATETSTVTFLSVPGIAYGGGLGGTGDLRFLQLPLGYLVGRAVVAWLLVPLYFQGRFLTAYEVLQKRFGGVVRRVASLLFMVTRTLSDGIRLFLTAIVLQLLTGFADWQCVAVLGIATIVYTFFGGMRAVVWTDFVQLLVYLGGAFVAFAVLLSGLDGGWGDVTALAAEEDKFRLVDFAFDVESTYTFWAGLVGGAFLTVGTHGVDQMIVQRYLCARSQGDARKALLWSGVVVALQFAFFLLLGIGLAAYYNQHPPAEPFTKSDRVLAHFVVNALPAGVLGIVLGAVFSAAMSTLSSSISSSATALINDFVLPRTGRPSDHPSTIHWTRAAVVMFGVLQIAVGTADWGEDGPVVEIVLAVAAVTTGVILGIFALGTLSKVGHNAALAGLLVGLAIVLLLRFGLPAWFDVAIAWPWFAMLGALATYGAGIVAGLFLPGPRSDTPSP